MSECAALASKILQNAERRSFKAQLMPHAQPPRLVLCVLNPGLKFHRRVSACHVRFENRNVQALLGTVNLRPPRRNSAGGCVNKTAVVGKITAAFDDDGLDLQGGFCPGGDG